MSGLWYSYERNSDHVLQATRHLTLEQRGAFNDLVDLIYMHDGEVSDQDSYIASVIQVSEDKWRQLRSSLLAAGSIRLKSGKLSIPNGAYFFRSTSP